MKHDLRLLALLLLLSGGCYGGCQCATVDPGHVGVKVDLFGEGKGVEPKILPVGVHWMSMGETLYEFPIYEQNYTWTHDKTDQSPRDESLTFQTKEGLSVNADIGITYHIPSDKVVTVFQKYRRGIDEITDTFLRNNVRDAINEIGGSMSVESVYGEGKAELMDKVQDRVAAEVKPFGIEVSKVYLIGTFRLPDSVVKTLNAKIEATQHALRVENEVKQAQAEGAKRVAAAEADARANLTTAEGEAKSKLARAEAEAKANALLNAALTDKLLELRRLEVERARVEKWNGQLPQTIMGGVTPLMNIDALTRK
jgi:regulator of protease activity HflC (stomatin/prohibitin superfamily)